ncbi:MAG: hypothetical protein AAFP23_03975 [Pseudomonadota bacterium]
MSLGGKLFGVVLLGLGLGVAGWHGETLWAAWQLGEDGREVTAEVTAKRIDQPHGRSRARVTSVSVNGVGIESPREWFKSHILEVRYTLDGAAHDADAPVSKAFFGDHAKGDRLSVRAAPGVPFADAEARATLTYALHRIAIGGVIAVVGVIVLRVDA